MNPKNRRQPRALLIEDHAALAEATAEFMRDKGLEVRIAASGREALEVVAVFHPEIVVCDMRLPDMPGAEVARALRATTGAKDAVIAMHTAMAASELRALARLPHPAVDRYLSKPMTEEHLDALITALQSRAKKDSRTSTIKKHKATGRT